MSDSQPQEVLYFENFDLESVVSPVDVDALERLLVEMKYDPSETQFLTQGFREGFSLGYERSEKVQLTAPNLSLNIGNETILWNKVMKEVKAKRYTGPFTEIPFTEDFIQSPIGLVPKDGGRDCRLIFHLSYPRNGKDSVNMNTDPQLCSVKYADFNDAVQLCLKAGRSCKIGKTDFKLAFHNLGIFQGHWRYLIMKARSPLDGKIYYFIDKCLPFGAGISCVHFQHFSNAVAHLVQWRMRLQTGKDQPLINYLDDFLFIALLKSLCNDQMSIFVELCSEIKFPIAEDKTVWGCTCLVFLGLLIDTVKQIILLPREKIQFGQELLNDTLNRKSRKVTVHDLQKIAGFLNFLGKAIVPGRAFT